MLANATIDGLYKLGLPAIARGLVEQRERPDHQGLSFEERLGMLVDLELQERENRRLQRALKAAKLRANAVIEDVDFRRRRGLERAQVLELAQSHWVQNRHNLLIVGPTGGGKTYLACALAHAGIRHGHSALYLRAPRMLEDLAIARADGRLARLLASWARVDILLLDDFLLRPLTPDQAADLLEVIEDRSQLRSTVVTSQLPVTHWHEALGEATVADAILDRLLHHAHRIEFSPNTESMRGRPGSADAEDEPVADYRPTNKKEVMVRG